MPNLIDIRHKVTGLIKLCTTHLVCPLLCAHLELELAVLKAEHLVRMQCQDVTQPPHVLWKK